MRTVIVRQCLERAYKEASSCKPVATKFQLSPVLHLNLQSPLQQQPLRLRAGPCCSYNGL